MTKMTDLFINDVSIRTNGATLRGLQGVMAAEVVCGESHSRGRDNASGIIDSKSHGSVLNDRYGVGDSDYRDGGAGGESCGDQPK